MNKIFCWSASMIRKKNVWFLRLSEQQSLKTWNHQNKMNLMIWLEKWKLNIFKVSQNCSKCQLLIHVLKCLFKMSSTLEGTFKKWNYVFCVSICNLSKISAHWTSATKIEDIFNVQPLRQCFSNLVGLRHPERCTNSLRGRQFKFSVYQKEKKNKNTEIYEWINELLWV